MLKFQSTPPVHTCYVPCYTRNWPGIQSIGIGVLHNKTAVPFLTSDNPVVWFDPSISEIDLKPYVLKPDGQIALLFPVSPSLLIYGLTSILERFVAEGIGQADLSDAGFVEMINRQVCRFGY
jgi:hypothetical protein